MILGVISDTHDRIATTEAAFRLFQQSGVTEVIHCGDWKAVDSFNRISALAIHYNYTLKGVLGNNDTDVDTFLATSNHTPHSKLREGVYELEYDDTKCAIYHGHHKPTLTKLRQSTQYDIIFLGHTHKAAIETNGSTMIVNPGSVAFSIPRSKAWKPTVAIVNTDLHTGRIEEVPLS